MGIRDEIRIIVKAATKDAINEIDKLNETLDKNKKKTDNSSQGATGLKKKWVAATAGIAAALGAAKTAFDFAKEYAEFEQSTMAMERQFGVSSDAIIQKLKEVSGGTISNKNIVLSANRAMALNVTKDQEKIAKMLEFARLRARAMGITTSQAFDDIVTGIGRGSPLILDNLGIITKGWNEEAKAAGVAYDSQFILNKVLSQASTELKNAGNLTLTHAERIQRMSASWDNLKVALGKAFMPALEVTADALTDFFNWMAQVEWSKGFMTGINAIIYAWDVMIQGFNVSIQWLKEMAATTIDWLTMPIVEGINLIIEAMNLLPGVNIDTLDRVWKDVANHNKKILEEEKKKFAAIEMEKVKVDKQERKREITNIKAQKAFTKASIKIDKDFFKTKMQNRGLDADAYMQWSSFMLGALNKNSRKQFMVWKAFSIQQAIINTQRAAIAGYNAMVGIPFVGPALATAAAATAIAFGGQTVNNIRKTDFKGAEEGAIIRGAPGSGTLIRAGENNKSEAIIPLEDEDQRFLGGPQLTINVENLYGTDELPSELVNKIDEGLFILKQDNQSRLF
jgi:hypothetical protein